ncbi:hypothetical protein NBRC116584_29180 [Hydrogenophaga sp. 5NK40-0174]
MSERDFFKQLIDEASEPFRLSQDRFAYHFARGKLSGDVIFREIVRQGLLPAEGRFLDLGCGQGSLFGFLLAAHKLHRKGIWPQAWAVPPSPSELRGIELMEKDVLRADKAFGPDHPVVRVEQGDMCTADFGAPASLDAVTILDALHYFDHAGQRDVLQRIRTALRPGGVFLTRIGDVSAGLPYRISNWVDHAVTFVRGHRLPELYGRPLAEWQALLREIGFEVETEDMTGRKPFANVMLLCRVPVEKHATEAMPAT